MKCGRLWQLFCFVFGFLLSLSGWKIGLVSYLSCRILPAKISHLSAYFLVFGVGKSVIISLAFVRSLQCFFPDKLFDRLVASEQQFIAAVLGKPFFFCFWLFWAFDLFVSPFAA